jgi:hypothetical protein
MVIRQVKYQPPGNFDKRDGMHLVEWLHTYTRSRKVYDIRKDYRELIRLRNLGYDKEDYLAQKAKELLKFK